MSEFHFRHLVSIILLAASSLISLPVFAMGDRPAENAAAAELKTRCEAMSKEDNPHVYQEGKLVRFNLFRMGSLVHCYDENKRPGSCYPDDTTEPAGYTFLFKLKNNDNFQIGVGGNLAEMKRLRAILSKESDYAFCYKSYDVNNRKKLTIINSKSILLLE